MAYNDTPLANQRIKDTQSPIRDNFANIQTAFSIDHVAIQNLPDEGKHNRVTMPEQGGPPGTLVNEMALFTQMSANTTNSELYLQRESGGVSIPVSEASPLGTGWGWLPNGILMKWKSQSVPLVGNNLVNFADTPARFASIFHVQLTINGVIGVPGLIYVNGVNLAPVQQTVTVNCSVANLSVYVLVMGTPV